MAYFASIGLSPPPSPTSSAASAASGQNPADFLLSLLAASSVSEPSPTGEEGALLDAVNVGINSGINSGRTGAAAATAAAAATGRSFSAGGSAADAGAGAGGAGDHEKEDDEDEDRDEGYSSSSTSTCGRPYVVTPAELGRAYYESAASVGIREGVEREAAEAAGAHGRGGGGGRRWRRRRGGRSRKRKDYSTVWLSTVLTHRQVCGCVSVRVFVFVFGPSMGFLA